jgi:hypothetical protein
MLHCAYDGPYSTAISAIEKLAAGCHSCPLLSACLASLTSSAIATGPCLWANSLTSAVILSGTWQQVG